MDRLFPAIGFAVLTIMAGAQAQTSDSAAHTPNVENGRYIYYAGGCSSCHAAPASSKCDDPKIADEFKPVGGRCLKTGFGTFYVPNITPDKETGIGTWSNEDFVKSMREGTSPEGENHYPAFPYTSYQRMKREDVLDLFAFLKTLEPVSSSVPDHELSFPYNIRSGLTVWKSFYLDGEPFKADPKKSDHVNRGAYLVEGPGHCAECHTPRDSFGGMIADKKLGGAPNPDGEGFIPNITPHETGIGSWSEKDIVFALQTGFLPDGDVIGGTMTKVQKNLAKLSTADIEAIAAYLKSVPPVASERRKKN
jgi:mono/diheme cytochrome c family protein